MKEMFKSAVHLILIKDNKILVQKRMGTKLWNGYYALPAGHIDSGENQYEALIREAKEELGIIIDEKDILNSYVVLRRNYFEIDGKILEPYVDFYFEVKNYKGTPSIMECDKCSSLDWYSIDSLPSPFINYEGEFLNNKNIKTYDCMKDEEYKMLVKK